MTTNLRTGNILAALVLLGGLGACTTQAANGTGTGGTGGGATATGGSTGTGTGGTSSAGGASGYPASPGVACLPPAASGLITNFTYMPGDAAAPVTDQVTFGDNTTTLSGGEFYYPNASATPTPTYPLTSLVTASNWHITGTVGDYSGFGFYFQSGSAGCNVVNATGFKGISFTISGTVQGQSLTFEVDTLNDTIKPAWLSAHGGTPGTTDPGACDPGGTASTTQYSQSVCTEPTTSIPVTSTPTMVSVLWSRVHHRQDRPEPGSVRDHRHPLDAPGPRGRRRRRRHDVSARHHHRQHCVHSAMTRRLVHVGWLAVLALGAAGCLCPPCPTAAGAAPVTAGGGLNGPAPAGRQRQPAGRLGRRGRRARARRGGTPAPIPRSGCSKVGHGAGRRHRRQHGDQAAR